MISSLPSLRIVWPADLARPWEMRLLTDTDRDLASVCLSLQLRVEPSAVVTADLDLLIDETEQPMAHEGPTLLTPDGRGYRHKVFSYVVTEMQCL